MKRILALILVFLLMFNSISIADIIAETGDTEGEQKVEEPAAEAEEPAGDEKAEEPAGDKKEPAAEKKAEEPALEPETEEPASSDSAMDTAGAKRKLKVETVKGIRVEIYRVKDTGDKLLQELDGSKDEKIVLERKDLKGIKVVAIDLDGVNKGVDFKAWHKNNLDIVDNVVQIAENKNVNLKVRVTEVILSDDATLKSIEQVANIVVTPSGEEHTIYVKDLASKPTITIEQNDVNATLVVDDQGDTVIATVTAENGDVKVYTIKYVVRALPTIQLNGPSVTTLYQTTRFGYIDPNAVATNADGLMTTVTGVGSVDLSQEGSYTLTYNYEDTVLVYENDALVALQANPVTRSIEVVEDYGEVYVQHYDVSQLRALKDSGAWISNSLNTQLGAPIIKVADHGDDNWTQTAYEDAFLNHRSGTEKTAQKVYGYINPDVAIDGIRVSVDDGIRLYLDTNGNDRIDFNSELKIDSWKTQGKRTYTNMNVDLDAGDSYLFLIDYFNWGGRGVIHFEANVNGSWITVLPHWFSIVPGMEMPEPSSEKNISEYSFTEGTGVINQTDKTISVRVPFGTDVSALTPSITFVGETVSPGETVTDFTSPVTYTVTAEDGSTVDYVVTVEMDLPPVATNVIIIGTPEVGQTLTGSYDYSDPNGDAELDSTYQWYANTGELGAFEPISGANNLDFVLTSAYGDKEVKFEVTPRSNYQAVAGVPVQSESVSIAVKYNFWITVDDYHEVYVNGVKLVNKDKLWSTIDQYFLFVDPGQVTIAVKGIDQKDGAATISGFRAAFQNTDGSWIATDNSWSTWTPVKNEMPADYGEIKWFEPGYAGTKWVQAHVLADPHQNWPKNFPEASNSNYIWTDDYKVAKDHVFDSPVYFRNIVTVLNALPVAVADSASTDEDTAVEINVIKNDSDFEGDVTVNAFSQGTNGTVTLSNGLLVYTPNKNYYGNDTFTYTAKDEENGVSNEVTVSVEIKAVNDGPVATGESTVTNEDVSVSVQVLDNDTDPENDPVSLNAYSQGENGTVTEENGVLTYTPDHDYNGTDFFTYTVKDDKDAVSNEVRVEVKILPVDEFEVSFNSMGGTSVEPQTVNLGESADAPKKPEKDNSSFLYWTLDGVVYTFEEAVTGHIELVAVWQTVEIDVPETEAETEAVILNIGYLKTIEEGKANLMASLTPDGEYVSATWTIESGEGHIALTEDGEVSGLAATGNTPAVVKVTVVLEDETVLTATVPVMVIYSSYPAAVRQTVSIRLDKDEVELEYGTEANEAFLTYDLTETISGSSDKRVVWSIEDPEVATVDENGVITAVKEGETTVTVRHIATGHTASADIIVFLVGEEETPLGAVEFYSPYIVGYPDLTFGPERSVTRAEIATMFAKILNLNLNFPGSQKFNDVNEGEWYYNYVQAIARTGLFVGDGNGEFRPNAPMTNAEIAAVFANYWKFLNIEVDATKVELSDVQSSHWASNYIYMMFNAGIKTDVTGGFNPDENTLREEVVGMVNALISRPKYYAEATKYVDITNAHWAYGDIEAASQMFNALVETEE